MLCHSAPPTAGPTIARIDHAVCAVRLRQEDAIVSWQRDQLRPPSSQSGRLLESQPTMVRGCYRVAGGVQSNTARRR